MSDTPYKTLSIECSQNSDGTLGIHVCTECFHPNTLVQHKALGTVCCLAISSHFRLLVTSVRLQIEYSVHSNCFTVGTLTFSTTVALGGRIKVYQVLS
jgi:hypothetical protein